MATESIFTRASNLLNYKLYQATTDPDAKRFADEQNAARKKQEEAEAAAAAKNIAETKKAEIQSENLKKAEYSTGTFIGQIVKYTLISFAVFIFVLFAVYTGHLAANDAIGRSYWYRILYFIYGCIFCVFVAPYYIIQYFRSHSVKSYAILPIREGDVPRGIEGFILSLISFTPDSDSNAAKAIWDAALRRSASV
jgi:uncharacterized membrane protein (DUF106 family)